MSENELRLQETLHQLETNNRRQFWLCVLSCLTCMFIALGVYLRPAVVSASASDKDGIMHVRGLVVDDSSGHERVRLGAPLPDPLIRNVRMKRQGVLSGIVLTDATGTERSGYATEEEGEAFLALDSQHGQEMTLLTNPAGGTNLDIFRFKGQ